MYYIIDVSNLLSLGLVFSRGNTMTIEKALGFTFWIAWATVGLILILNKVLPWLIYEIFYGVVL